MFWKTSWLKLQTNNVVSCLNPCDLLSLLFGIWVFRCFGPRCVQVSCLNLADSRGRRKAFVTDSLRSFESVAVPWVVAPGLAYRDWPTWCRSFATWVLTHPQVTQSWCWRILSKVNFVISWGRCLSQRPSLTKQYVAAWLTQSMYIYIYLYNVQI